MKSEDDSIREVLHLAICVLASAFMSFCVCWIVNADVREPCRIDLHVDVAVRDGGP